MLGAQRRSVQLPRFDRIIDLRKVNDRIIKLHPDLKGDFCFCTPTQKNFDVFSSIEQVGRSARKDLETVWLAATPSADSH